MIIGIPRETKCGEGRVAIDAEGLKVLARKYPDVEFWVEEAAGWGSEISNADYAAGGTNVKVCVPRTSLWRDADLIVKVKEPQPDEILMLARRYRPVTVFGYFHIEAASEQLKALVSLPHITAIAFENIVVDNRRVLLEPMSIVAGEVAVIKGMSLLKKLPQDANAMILGLGVAGMAAHDIAWDLFNNVWTYDVSVEKMLKTYDPVNEQEMRSYLKDTDLLISSVYNPFCKADKLLDEADIARMRPNGVFVDISIDQGGSSTTSRPTSIEKPTYIVQDITHFCVPNMPGFVPQTSTRMLSNAVVPFVSQLVEHGLMAAQMEVFGDAIVEVK